MTSPTPTFLAFWKKAIFTFFHEKFDEIGANVLKLITDCEQSVVVVEICLAIRKIRMMQKRIDRGEFRLVYAIRKRKRPLAVLKG